MTVRATMADLITRVRGLVGDPAGASQVFADQDYQDALDQRRTDIVEVQLSFRPTMVGGGPVVQYRDYWAPFGNWEDGVLLKDASNVTVTPDSADLLHGHWTWTGGHLPPLFITGAFYDVYGSAAGLLDQWAGKVVMEFDFTADGQTFRRSQKREGLVALANTYRRFAVQPGRRPLWRSDTWRLPVWGVEP